MSGASELLPASARPTRRQRRRERAIPRRREVSDLLVTALVTLAVGAPMLFTDSGFSLDFTNHLWLVWAAGHSLIEAGHPDYFLNAGTLGVFDPWFAFYGGTLYMLAGAVSALTGAAILAFIAVTLAAVAASYLGMLSLSRQCGLRGWSAHAPALVVVTSAYYITDLYGRGAWPEFMATAVIAPLLASGVRLLRAPTVRPGPAFVFVVCVVIFTGSHNITLLWGGFVALLAGAMLGVALRPLRLSVRRVATVAGLGVVSLLINAWYLFPDIAYASDVKAHAEAIALAGASFLDTPQVLLDPLRTVPAASSTPALFVQVPLWFLLWGLVAGGLLLWRRGVGRRLRRSWLAGVLLTGVLLGMIMDTPLWGVMPFPLDEIQYPYRLGTYVYYGVAGLVLVGVLALEHAAPAGSRRRLIRGLRVALIAVCAVSVGLCVWQLWVPKVEFPESYANRQGALASVTEAPYTWYDGGSYNDISAPIVQVPSGRSLLLSASLIEGDHFAAWVRVPPGMAPILTNIAGGRYLVHLSGLTWLGRSQNGYAVVRREREGSGPVHVELSTADSTPIVLGTAVSIAACLVLVAALAGLCVRSLRARHAAPA